MKARAARRLVAAAFAIGLAGTIGLACPSRELRIDISGDGYLELVTSCNSNDPCSPPIADAGADGSTGMGGPPGGPATDAMKRCSAEPILCEIDGGTCQLRNQCLLDGHPTWDPGGITYAQLLLLDFGGYPPVNRATSACMPLANCKSGDSPTRSACAAADLNQQIDAAIAGGFSFSGFDDPSTAVLALAFFQVKAGATNGCDLSGLVACGGLSASIGQSVYDLSCASCQKSTHFSVGRDTGACPSTSTDCFLTSCAAALGAAPRGDGGAPTSTTTTTSSTGTGGGPPGGPGGGPSSTGAGGPPPQ